ncbi:MAG: PspA/IM30 family protein [Phycisphaerae bacterium]|nr:PspA/IM30 family protein [Phycisphaerae bacterium]
MGLFRRLHRITFGRIEAFLDRVEDPEQVFPILVKEMEKQLEETAQAEAKASANLKQAKRELQRHQERLTKYNRGAVLAIQKNDDQTAQMAVEAQIDLEKVIALAQQNYDRAVDALDHAHVSRKRIGRQLDELRSKKQDLLTRAKIVKAQKKIQRTVTGGVGNTDSILDSVARLESNIEEAESQLEIQACLVGDDLSTASLDRQLRELDHETEIQRRLAQIRKEALCSATGESLC